MSDYGKEVILDLHNCNPDTFDLSSLRRFCFKIAPLMEAEIFKFCEWSINECPPQWREEAHLNGNSVVAFISTSSITIHALTDLRKVFVNAFTCSQNLSSEDIKNMAEEHFGGTTVQQHTFTRV